MFPERVSSPKRTDMQLGTLPMGFSHIVPWLIMNVCIIKLFVFYM